MVGGLALLFLLALGASLTDVAFGDLTRDPAAVADLEAYVGALSHTGVMLMSGTATVSMFGAVVMFVPSIAGTVGDDMKETARFLGYMGGLTALLAIDDAFMIHDRLIPRLTPFPESIVFIVYILVTCYGLYRFRTSILRSRAIWFFAALVCFAGSLVVDRAADQDNASGLHFFVEDGFKFIGYICWAIFFVGATWHAIRDVHTRYDTRHNPEVPTP